jgi:hypothetical protein
MSDKSRKVQLTTEVDTSKTKAGFAEVKRDAKDMAQEVSTAGKAAGAGMDAIGEGAKRASATMAREEGKLSASIKRATFGLETLGKSASEKFAIKIDTQGLDAAKFQPALVRLRELEAGLQKTGISAGQTAAALRMVPAQFTDIATSLAGGQSPLTVLMQQGGQLKDSFGGIGPAAKALGGYVASLVTPATLAAAAMGGLAAAYVMGAAESEEFNKQIILSGNAAGVTAGQLASMAAGVSAVVGTQGKAAEVLAMLVGTGRVASDVLSGATVAIVSLSESAGASVEDLVKDFAELGKAPAEAVVKLNDKYRFLTEAVYEQIVALEKQGRADAAAEVAQKALADALTGRAASVRDNAGLMESAWRGVAGVAKGAWDAMLNVGRQDTQDQVLGKMREQLASMQAMRKFNASVFGSASKSGPELALEQSISNLQTKGLQDAAGTRRQAVQRQIDDAGIGAAQALEKQREGLAKGAAKVEGELKKYRDNLDKIRLANPNSPMLSANLIAADEAAIKDKYAEKVPKAPKGPKVSEEERALERYRNLVDDLAAKQDGFSATFNNDVAALHKGWLLSGDSVAVYDKAFDNLLKKQPYFVDQQRAAAEAEREFARERKKRFDDIEQGYEREVRSAEQSAKSVADRVQAMVDEEAALERSRTLNISLAQALEDVHTARLEDARALALADGEQERADALTAEINARRELARLTDRKATRDESTAGLKDFLKADIGTDFAAGFDKASQSLGVFAESLTKLSKVQGDYNKLRASGTLNAADTQALDSKFAEQQLSSYASLTGAAKGFFKEQSQGYKALQTAEQVLRAFELASTAQRIAAKFAEGSAVAAVGVANQAAGDPYTAFPRMAAMAAAMAGLGFAVGGAFGSSGSEPLPSNKGAGTVLGDSSKASESITNAIDGLSDIDSLTMQYSAQMAASLRNIEGNIGGLASLLVQSGGMQSSAFGVVEGFQSNAIGKTLGSTLGGAQLGSMIGGLLGPLGLIGGAVLGGLFKDVIGKLFGTKTSIVGQGITAGGQSVGSILDGGFQAQYFTDVNTKKKAFGLTYSNKTRTQYTDADAQMERQIGSIFGNFSQLLLSASQPLGRDLGQVSGAIRGFVVDIGRVDLKGLTGEQISERLTNVFSAAGDSLAASALGGLQDFQKVGEGYLQTVVRTASGVEEARVVLAGLAVAAVNYASIGNKQGDVGAELVRESLLATEALGGVADMLAVLDGDAKELAATYKTLVDVRSSLSLMGFDSDALGFSLVQGAGGLDALASSLKDFSDGFLSDSEQVGVKLQKMVGQFSKLGLALPDSGAGFAALVRGIDTSSDAGKQLLGNVLQLSGGFSELLKALQGVGSGIESEIERIRGLTGSGGAQSMAQIQASFAINTAQARAGDQAAIDALPGLSRALLEASSTQASSSAEVALLQARTLGSLQETLRLITDPTARAGKVPAFATGGDHLGGLRLVGERGAEIEATGPARYWDAATTARMLSGGGSDDLAPLLRSVLALLEQIRGDQVTGDVQLARNTGQLLTVITRLVREGDRLAVTTG